MSEDPADDNVFDVFETVPEVLAYLHRKGGDDALRLVLQGGKSCREDLEDHAAELEGIGLGKAASIVREAAALRPPYLATNPYEQGTTNWRAWDFAARRRARFRWINPARNP